MKPLAVSSFTIPEPFVQEIPLVVFLKREGVTFGQTSFPYVSGTLCGAVLHRSAVCFFLYIYFFFCHILVLSAKSASAVLVKPLSTEE